MFRYTTVRITTHVKKVSANPNANAFGVFFRARSESAFEPASEASSVSESLTQKIAEKQVLKPRPLFWKPLLENNTSNTHTLSKAEKSWVNLVELETRPRTP